MLYEATGQIRPDGPSAVLDGKPLPEPSRREECLLRACMLLDEAVWRLKLAEMEVAAAK